MNYVRFKEYNGNQTCYQVDYYMSEDMEKINAERDRRKRIHKTMPGTGYSDMSLRNEYFKEKEILGGLVAQELNKKVKLLIVRERDQDNFNRLKPLTQFQLERSLELTVSVNSTKPVDIQIRHRRFVRVHSEHDEYLLNQKDKEEPLAANLAKLADILKHLKRNIETKSNYKVLK